MPTDAPRHRCASDPAAATAYQGFETATKWLELLRKASISVAVVLAISVVAVLIIREACEEGIVTDPVIVQLNDLKEPLTPELAAPLHCQTHRRYPAQRRQRMAQAIR